MLQNLTYKDYVRQAGTVVLHDQGTLSDSRYKELQNATKLITNFIKGTDYKVDMYDVQSVPVDKFVYRKEPNGVYVEITDMLHGEVKSAESFFDGDSHKEPFVRQIYRFIDDAYCIESPLKRLKDITNNRFRKEFRGEDYVFDTFTFEKR